VGAFVAGDELVPPVARAGMLLQRGAVPRTSVYSHTASIKFLNQDSFSDKIKDRLKIKKSNLDEKNSITVC
jgi:hypothetical protein